MAKMQQIGVRLPDDVKTALETAAKEDLRSVSSLVEKIIMEWLIKHGKMKGK